MAKKKKKSASVEDVSVEDMSKDLWISPRFSLKAENSETTERSWGTRAPNNPGSARFLELADVALGTKKPELRKKRPIGAAAHVTAKTEPYSR